MRVWGFTVKGIDGLAILDDEAEIGLSFYAFKDVEHCFKFATIVARQFISIDGVISNVVIDKVIVSGVDGIRYYVSFDGDVEITPEDEAACEEAIIHLNFLGAINYMTETQTFHWWNGEVTPIHEYLEGDFMGFSAAPDNLPSYTES